MPLILTVSTLEKPRVRNACFELYLGTFTGVWHLEAFECKVILLTRLLIYSSQWNAYKCKHRCLFAYMQVWVWVDAAWCRSSNIIETTCTKVKVKQFTSLAEGTPTGNTHRWTAVCSRASFSWNDRVCLEGPNAPWPVHVQVARLPKGGWVCPWQTGDLFLHYSQNVHQTQEPRS